MQKNTKRHCASCGKPLVRHRGNKHRDEGKVLCNRCNGAAMGTGNYKVVKKRLKKIRTYDLFRMIAGEKYRDYPAKHLKPSVFLISVEVFCDELARIHFAIMKTAFT